MHMPIRGYALCPAPALCPSLSACLSRTASALANRTAAPFPSRDREGAGEREYFTGSAAVPCDAENTRFPGSPEASR